MTQPTPRRYWLAALLGLFVCASSASAQTDLTFAPVPLSHWAYRIVDQLDRRGYPTGLPSGTFDGSRGVTRYDFATALNTLLNRLPDSIGRPREEGGPGPGPLDQLRADVRAVRRLLAEFGPDVALLGANPDDARSTLDAVDGRLTRLLGANSATPPGGGYGIGAFLEPPLLDIGLELAARQPLPSDRLQPIAISPNGDTVVALNARDLDPLLRVRELPPFVDPSTRASFGAELQHTVGNYLVTAFYLREGHQQFRGELGAELLGVGPRSGVGAAVSRSFGDSLRVDLSGASYAAPYGAQFGDLLAFRGGIRYVLSRQWSVDAGVERLVNTGVDGQDAQVYNLGVGKAFGSNMRLQLLYQYFNLAGPRNENRLPLSDGSAAVTRFMLRF